MKPIRTILVARDFSPCAERALDTALSLAARTGATLHLARPDVREEVGEVEAADEVIDLVLASLLVD